MGQPLPSELRHRLESVLGTDLEAVRIHTGPTAQQAAAQVNARAFTVGSHIYLNRGESPSDLALIAHETAHAVQQSATLHGAQSRGPPQSGSSPHLSAAPHGMIQRESNDDSLIPAFLSDAVGAVTGAVEEGFWYAVDTFVPREITTLLHQIRDQGFWGMLKEKIGGAIDFVFATLKNQGGSTAAVATLFEALIAKATPILSALAGGNCQPLFEAVKSLGAMLGQMAGDVWDQITNFLQPVGDWLSNVWKTFGAPVVDFLGEFASDTWAWITHLGQRLWDLTKPVRSFYSGAWTEIKNLLGFNQGGDGDGSAGLIGWIKGKAGEIWDEIKQELSPVIEPVQAAATSIKEFLPLNPIVLLREKILAWFDQATAMADNMDQPDDVAKNQDLLRDIVLPGLTQAIGTLRSHVSRASNWVTTAVGELVGKVTGFTRAIASTPLLAPFQGALNWVKEEAGSLGQWAADKAVAVLAYADLALVTLEGWIAPIIAMLRKLIGVLGDLMGLLPNLVLGPLLLVPKCIRDPIQDFIVTRILKQIPIFSQLFELPDIWAKIQSAFQAVIVKIFRDGDLFGAAWTYFRTILELLGVPPQLITNLIRNVAKSFKDVLRNPLGFLVNLLKSVGMGYLQFLSRIGKHLLNGAVDWLLSGVRGAGVNLPDPFEITLRNVIDLVLQVLNLTKEKIFERVEKQKGAAIANRVRKMVAAGEKIFEWIYLLFTQGPAALWAHLKQDLANLWMTMLDTVIDFLIGKIVQMATIWITKTFMSGGWSLIFDALKAIYDAMMVLKDYMVRLLEIVNSVFVGIGDIAKGVLTKGADMVENAAARLIPAVLAFLAKTLGIGSLPKAIREAIQKIRKKVEDAIDKLIEKTFAAIDWAKEKGQQVIDKLKEWWVAKEIFTTDDGETHSIAIEGEDAAAKVVVRSELLGLDAAVDRVEANDQAPKTVKGQARQNHTQINAAITEMKGVPIGTRPDSSDPNYSKLRKLNGTVRKCFRALTPIFAKYLFDSGTDLPTEPKTAFTVDNDKALSAEITELSANRKMGTVPGTAQPRGWKAIVATGLTSRAPTYVRLHLINENFGGLGENKNLVPGPTLHNNLHRRGVEEPIKKLVGDTPKQKTFKGVVWMNAKVTHHTSAAGVWPKAVLDSGVEASDFASAINVTWGLHERDGSSWAKREVVGSYQLGPIPLPKFLEKDAAKLKAALT